MNHRDIQRIWFAFIGRPAVQWLIRWWWVIVIFILATMAFCCATLTPQQEYHALKIHYQSLQQDAIYAMEHGLLSQNEIEKIQRFDRAIVKTIHDVSEGRLVIRAALVNLKINIKRMGEVLHGSDDVSVRCQMDRPHFS